MNFFACTFSAKFGKVERSSVRLGGGRSILLSYRSRWETHNSYYTKPKVKKQGLFYPAFGGASGGISGGEKRWRSHAKSSDSSAAAANAAGLSQLRDSGAGSSKKRASGR